MTMRMSRWFFGAMIVVLVMLFCVLATAQSGDRPVPKPEPIHAPVEFKAGIYKVNGDIDGRAYWGSCTITKHHDAYRSVSILRMDRRQPLQSISGVGILLGDRFAVGGPSGVALYRVMDDGELVGSWSADNGRVHRERMTLLKAEEE